MLRPRGSASVDLVGAWLSLVEHLVRDQGVGGSNPLAPTNFFTYPAAAYTAICREEMGGCSAPPRSIQ
jgi:hypothetical protein